MCAIHNVLYVLLKRANQTMFYDKLKFFFDFLTIDINFFLIKVY